MSESSAAGRSKTLNSEIEIKTERIRRLLEADGLGGVLLNAQHNFAWATGGRSNAINRGAENGCCFLFYRADGRRFLLANNIEMPRLLSEQVSADDFEPVEMPWPAERTGHFVIDEARRLAGANKHLASDLYLSADLKPIEGSIARCRYSLTPHEVERYRALGRDAGEVFRRIFDTIAPGETELEIAAKLNSMLATRGFETTVTLVGADERVDSFRHPLPTANVWQKKLLIVACARRDGLFANLSRIAYVGEPPSELENKTRTCANVFAQFLNATRVGAKGSNLYEIAVAAYAKYGFADEIAKHHQGGATGYKGRDWVAHPKCGEIVADNQAFAWNPSIAGTKAEETVIASAGGIEYLTTSNDFPQIAVEVDGKEYFAPGILKL